MRYRLAALALSLLGAALVIWPVITAPSSTVVCGWVHPDCLGNHWLLVWVAEQLSAGQGIVHNSRYYWPIGDAPWLAGNGSDGFLYLPWHLLLGWPTGAAFHTLTILTLDGLGAYALARAAGASRSASLAAAPTAAMMVYSAFELGAGRFSQANFGFLAFFLASWLQLLDAPSVRRALVSAALLAATSFFYWYYGLFGVMAGAVLLAARGRAVLRAEAVRPLALFAGAFLLFIGPVLAVFALHYASIPGTAEATQFPHPEVAGDSCWPAVPFMVGGGRHAGRALPFTTSVLGVLALAFRRDRTTYGLAAVGLVFTALMAGPLWPNGPYEWVYGLAGPLRRFWWPYRHVVVLNLMWITLAAVAMDKLKADWPKVVLALTIPAQLEVARSPFHALWSKAEVPVEFYQRVGELEGSVLIEVPLSPEVAASQAPLIYQFDHQKTLLNGHALWVKRVRPEGWDERVSANSFLAALQALERGELAEGSFRFAAADLQSLLDQGVRTLTVNREYFPVRLSELTMAYGVVMDALFGEPAVIGTRAKAWDLGRWTGATEVLFPAFTWPSDLQRGGPTLPVQAARPPSLAFAMPAPTTPPPPPGGKSSSPPKSSPKP